MAQLPTADEFFSSATEPAKALPTADEFFGKPARVIDGNGPAPLSTPEADEAWIKGPAKKVLDAFGEGFGEAEIGLTEESKKALREYGVFNDYEKSSGTVGKALNEVLLRPAAYSLDVLLRGTAGVFRAGQEAVQQGILAAGGDPRLARDVAGMPEAFFGGPGSFGPRISRLNEARRLKVIGHGEEGWRGTSTKADEVVPEQPMRAEAPDAPAPTASAPIDAGLPPPADGMVRFYHGGENPNTGGPRWATPDPDYARNFRAGDTPNKVHYVDVPVGSPAEIAARAWDDIDEAGQTNMVGRYQHTELPEEWASRLQPVPDQATSTRPAKPIEEQRAFILSDVREKLVAAGRPADEAEAAAAIDAAYWETRAARFGGKKGTAEEMYLRDAPEIVAGKDQRAVTMAQKGEMFQISPEQARSLPYDTKLPDDATFKRAVDNTPGAVLEPDGLRITLSRWQKREQAGEDSVRTGVFYLPDGSPNAKHYKSSPTKAEDSSYGGSQKYTGDTLLRAPIFVKGATGGKAPEAAYDAIKGKGAFKDLERDVMQWVNTGWMLKKEPGLFEEAVAKFLDERGGDGSMAAEIIRHSNKGNRLRYALQEHLIAHTVRESGYDSVVGYSVGRDPAKTPRISEVFDVRETRYPGGVVGVHPKFSELSQAGDVKRGRIRLREEGRNTITLLKEANASTFIHEKGHDYLARLMMDAADEAAPAILKQDADTVLKWLGVEKADDIKTKHHEQFARGFERYMREGVAPHPTLARVFEKFRQWLVRIYQEVTRLKVDINDDIRGVYDRLLAVDPQRTGIIPDEAIKKAAERFEELAVSAGEDAGILADAAAQNRAKLTADAGLGGVTEEARRGAPGRALPDDISAQPGIDAQRAGERAESGASGASRSEAEAESARQRGEANASLPRAETPLTDKAGNIRLENLGTPEDVNAVLRQAAAENEGFIAQRRGVISDAEVSDLADALGMDAKMLDRRKIGEAFNAEQVIAARKLLIQSATHVRDAMAKAASGKEADIVAYAEAKSRHLMIQGQVSGITAEAGRALRAFRALDGDGMAEAKSLSAFLQENTGKTLYQLQREAQMGMQLDTPAKVSKYVQDSSKATWADMAVEVWINALLSGPKTHATNILSNTLVALYRVPETAVAAGVGRVRSAVTGNQERVRMGEAGARMFGFVQGAKDGVRAGWDVFKNEDLVEHVSKIEQRRFQAIPGKAGEIVRIPGRALAAEDAVFRAIAHRQELNALAYRKAMDEGLEGDRFARRVADLVENPTEDMIKAAQENASYQTFQTKLGRIGGSVQGFANSHPLVKLVIPFVRTPVNIIKFAQERSLFGLFSREVRENIAKGGATADTQIARIVMGSAVSTAAISMALEGTITGGGPTDSKQRSVLFQTGWQPYSVKIGEHYYSFSRLEPIAMLFGIAADMAEIGETATDVEADEVGKLVLASVAKNLTSKTWLSGPSELIKAVHDPDRYGQRYIQRFVGTVVPTGIAQIAQTQDPYLREARTIVDTIKARVPGLSQTLLPRRDIWGEPIRLEGGLGPDLLSPVYESRMNNDPVNQTLLRLNVFPARIARKIRGVELSDDQYDDFARLAGRTTKMRLDQIVSMPGFSALPDFAQRELVTRTIDKARETARSMMMMQNPAIIESALEAKRESLNAR